MPMSMAKPSISVPDELLDQFDDELLRRKYERELPRDTNRSDIMRALMEAWVEGNSMPPTMATLSA